MSLLSKFCKGKQKPNSQQDVLEHICDLLNTKRGYGSFDKSYGLASYTDLCYSDLTSTLLADDIKRTIEKYEKRLNVYDVTIIPNDNPLVLSFKISCKIKDDMHSILLSFEQLKKTFKLEASV